LRIKALDGVVFAASGAQALKDVKSILVDPARAGTVEFRGRLLAALGALDTPDVAPLVLDAYPALEPELKPRAVELLTQRGGWSLSLLKAIKAGKVNPGDLNVNQIRKLVSSKDPSIAALAKAHWGTVREGRNPQREQVINRVRDHLRSKEGDAVAGAQVFKKLCAQCHKIYGEGQEVGPEITSNGRGSYEQLLSNVLDPSLVIGSAFQATTVATTDGRVLTGLLVEQSPQRTVLKLQGGKVETIPADQIDEVKLSSLSLMPEDLENQLQPQEIVDLFSYITLDKPPTDPNARPIPGAQEIRRKSRSR
jgi:putative heme-binding domain-containing protein